MDRKHIPMRAAALKWALFSEKSMAHGTQKAHILQNMMAMLQRRLPDHHGTVTVQDTDGAAADGHKYLREAKLRAHALCPEFLVDTGSFAKGSFRKNHFDLLMWSDTPVSARFLRLCTDQQSYFRFMSLSADKRGAVVSLVRDAVEWMAERCDRQRLCRFDEALYPTRGPWNDDHAQSYINGLFAAAKLIIVGRGSAAGSNDDTHTQVNTQVNCMNTTKKRKHGQEEVGPTTAPIAIAPPPPAVPTCRIIVPIAHIVPHAHAAAPNVPITVPITVSSITSVPTSVPPPDPPCTPPPAAAAGTPNHVYLNVQPPVPLMQRFDCYPVKIGKSVTGGRMRIEQEAHGALFRPLCDIYVTTGPSFRKRTHDELGVEYLGVKEAGGYDFEHFLHHKWDRRNNRHLVSHYKRYTHEEMFHMDTTMIRTLLREVHDDQERYDYHVMSIKAHEDKWASDHPGWGLVFSST